MPEGIDAWWDDFEKLEVDGKLDLLYNTFAREEEEEFWDLEKPGRRRDKVIGDPKRAKTGTVYG
jgi:hypothetical protein